jgi:hypothetical protein
MKELEENLRRTFAYFTSFEIELSKSLKPVNCFEKECELKEEFQAKCWSKFIEILGNDYLEKLIQRDLKFYNRLISTVYREIFRLRYKKRSQI